MKSEFQNLNVSAAGKLGYHSFRLFQTFRIVPLVITLEQSLN